MPGATIAATPLAAQMRLGSVFQPWVCNGGRTIQDVKRTEMNPEALLSQISEIVAKWGPRLERLQQVAAALRQSAGYRWVGLYEVDASRGEVRNLVWDGPAAPEYPIFPITKGLTSNAIAKKKTVNVGDVGADPRYLTALGSTRSEIIVPISNDQGDVVGTIDVESERSNAFDQSTERLLEDCAVLLRPLFAGSSPESNQKK
jgi:L-methionine (R)-S-oxide reductase